MLSSPKNPLHTENRCSIHFIIYSSCNFGYIRKTRRRLEPIVDVCRRNVKINRFKVLLLLIIAGYIIIIFIFLKLRFLPIPLHT